MSTVLFSLYWIVQYMPERQSVINPTPWDFWMKLDFSLLHDNTYFTDLLQLCHRMLHISNIHYRIYQRQKITGGKFVSFVSLLFLIFQQNILRRYMYTSWEFFEFNLFYYFDLVYFCILGFSRRLGEVFFFNYYSMQILSNLCILQGINIFNAFL